MKNLTLRETIDSLIIRLECEKRIDCSLIAMHPNTWAKLFEECYLANSSAIYRHEPSLKYKGITVVRTLDLNEGSFEVR